MKLAQLGDSFWTLGLWVLAIRAAGGLSNVRLVLPPVVRAGTAATLLCLFDMEDAPLYSVKWYRGTREFYRFVPRNDPPAQAFDFPGISVDVTSSNAHQVFLRGVPLYLAGAFSCEVSADAPSFTTVTVTDNLTVLDFPDKKPVVQIESDQYLEGELLVVNCTAEPVNFQSSLTFYVNNVATSRSLVTEWFGGATLQFTPRRSDFSPRGEMRLKCVLSVMGQYHVSSRSVALWLQGNSTWEPQVVTVTSSIPRTAVPEGRVLFGLCLLTSCTFITLVNV